MKRFLIIFLFPLHSCLLMAQTSNNRISTKHDKALMLGWEIGGNRTYLRQSIWPNKQVEKLDKINGYKASLFAGYTWQRYWGLLGSLGYEREGTSVEWADVVYHLHYLKLTATPVFTYKGFHAYAGPYFSYLIRATDNIPENVIRPGFMTADKFNSFDFGLKSGVGVTFLQRFSLDFNYDHGWASAYDEPYYGANGHSINGYLPWKNRVFSLNLRVVLKQVALRKAAIPQTALPPMKNPK